MSEGKKKRLSMLDNLAAAGSPTPSSMMASSRPLRAARDAVDSHKVWELDPAQIIDSRVADRLSPEDVADLCDSIEVTGQTVPILVRRHPSDDEKYLLVYGRRRLEAIKLSNKVSKVRALIATLDEEAATEAQISENMARRDLTYIEKALFAHELIKSGFGNQTRVAEVLTVTKSSISMGLAIIEAIGVDLVRAIGPAQGVGRPRWDTLAKALDGSLLGTDGLVDLAERTRGMSEIEIYSATNIEDLSDPSVAAFEAVLGSISAKPQTARPAAKPKSDNKADATTLHLDEHTSASITRTKSGLRLDVAQGGFADWVEDQAQDLMQELHRRWQQHGKDT
jgi:ParB family chromosome partitioning protein